MVYVHFSVVFVLEVECMELLPRKPQLTRFPIGINNSVYQSYCYLKAVNQITASFQLCLNG